MPIDISIAGVGKIARDQHLPAIAANPDFNLVAAISRHATVDGVANFVDFDTFLAQGPAGAVALCTPPDVRTEMTLKAIQAGRDVLIEKPPAATLSEMDMLITAAKSAGVTLFATWHSRHAACVAPTRQWLQGKTIRRVTITWKEDVRRWHPGQDWIWQPGGFGVFDPGINALSILTAIIPGVYLQAANLVFPENRAQPIAATLDMSGAGAPITAEFDWRQEGPQTWDISIETDTGRLDLSNGGATMKIDGKDVSQPEIGEYPDIYRQFARLVKNRESDTDIAPLRLVADAFLRGRRKTAELFFDEKPA